MKFPVRISAEQASSNSRISQIWLPVDFKSTHTHTLAHHSHDMFDDGVLTMSQQSKPDPSHAGGWDQCFASALPHADLRLSM